MKLLPEKRMSSSYLRIDDEKIISLLEKSKKMIQREEYIENILHLKTELVLKRLDT